MSSQKTRKVCYVVCYRDPDYTRTNSLVYALSRIDNIELRVIKNKHRGLLRYGEVPLRLLAARLKFRPEVFVVGFRADEIFWAFYPAMMGKKIVFDEFINLHDWLVDEHQKLKSDSIPIKLIDEYMRWLTHRADMVLTDTEAHARLATKTYALTYAKVTAVPVGADEKLFYPRPSTIPTKKFKILFYGSMLPLHGVGYILDSMELLAERGLLTDVELTLVGGKNDKNLNHKLNELKKNPDLAKHIIHVSWVDLNKLPQFIAGYNLHLGGPFGNTGQARRVITGKTYQLLAMGVPVIVGRIEEIAGFKDKSNCLLVEQGSAEAIANAIEWAVKNKDELPKIGAAGHRLYEESFSSQSIAKQLDKLLSTI